MKQFASFFFTGNKEAFWNIFEHVWWFFLRKKLQAKSR